MHKDLVDKNIILRLTFDFALDIISYCECLEARYRYNLARQLFKSGTSIGANVREAQNAESKSDFIHKFKIAAKEMDETEYWLQLCLKSYDLENTQMLLSKLEQISKIITKIIATSKKSRVSLTD
ncbi:four helix bundle protein [Olivibacter sp. CPCC 100613]|uniref:four helix bundle protein n=1 Tax=Olivibacter sp. CPCC 100613 TaxID=3079931 RepID=UPI002FF6EBF1